MKSHAHTLVCLAQRKWRREEIVIKMLFWFQFLINCVIVLSAFCISHSDLQFSLFSIAGGFIFPGNIQCACWTWTLNIHVSTFALYANAYNIPSECGYIRLGCKTPMHIAHYFLRRIIFNMNEWKFWFAVEVAISAGLHSHKRRVVWSLM